MNKRNSLFIITIAFFGSLSACRHNPVGIENQPKVCFTEIKSIVNANCSSRSGCHGNDGQRKKYVTSADILQGVSPYKPYNSEIYTAITSAWSPMPPDTEHLSKELRTKILVWISQGADTSSVCQ